MMYCGKCGAKNEPGAAFCGSCGAPLGAERPGTAAAAEVAPKPAVGQSASKNKKIGIIAAAAVVIALVFAVFSLFGGRSDKAVAEQLFDAVLAQDEEALMDLIPKDMLNTVMEEEGYDKDSLRAEFRAMSSSMLTELLPQDIFGDQMDFSYKAIGSADTEPSHLSDVQESYKEYGVKVSGAREVQVEFTLRMDSLNLEESDTINVPVIKVGGTWYLDILNL